MKRSVLGMLVLGLFLASVGRAQTVTGSGTPNTIPQFTAPTTIGDSEMKQVAGRILLGGEPGRFPDAKLSVVNFDNAFVNDLQPVAVHGIITSDLNFSGGVRGDATSGAAIGVIGTTAAQDGKDGGGGIEGLTLATTGFSFGARGEAGGTTGNTMGVLGIQHSPEGTAGLFWNVAGGDILVGNAGPEISLATRVFRVDGNGRIFADGGFRPFGADFAESIAVSGNAEHYAPGDLLVIDASGERRLSLSQIPYSTLVAGIYSTQPGVIASTHRVGEALPKNEVPLAVVGVVPCKVTAENGPIAVGDLLVTSSTAGYAMKGTDRSRMLGAVVGKAFEPLRAGKGVIQVLVTLQ